MSKPEKHPLLPQYMQSDINYFFASFFVNIPKTAETILIQKIGRNHGISIYKKAPISEHRKNYIFRDNNCFVKMSVSLLVRSVS